MQSMTELKKEIETVRLELDELLLREEKFDICYQKSTKLDKLIEKYIQKTNDVR